jgi:hypothetical protein
VDRRKIQQMVGTKNAPAIQLSFVDMQSDYDMSGSENGFEFFSDKLRSKADYSKKSHHEIDMHQTANSA